MLSSVAKRLRSSPQCVRWFRTDSAPQRYRRPKTRPAPSKSPEDKSEWWIVDGEMHEIGENVPPRERFLIPSKNLPNRRRKKLREQFMRRTRLVLKETEHEPWCNHYLELYRELRENWERLYWDEGFSKKIAQDHANYDSAEDDDRDFSPYRSRPANLERSPYQNQSLVPQQGDTWQQTNPIRDKFEFDREKRMREIAFAPMNGGRPASGARGSYNNQQQNRNQQDQYQQFDVERYFPRD